MSTSSSNSAHEAKTTPASAIPGYATPEGTRRFTERHSGDGEVEFVSFGTAGWLTSRIGFGGYRVSDHVAEHGAALAKALREGVNLVDTASSYAEGRSERLVGRVLSELVESGDIARDEIVVVSKIGYIQGRSLERAKRRAAEGEPFPETVELSEASWHGIHPEILTDQLRRSLDRLGLETLDVCLLHNPECFLADAARRGEELEKSRDEFYRRLESSFAHLEEQVAAGRIACYGVASNTLASPVDAADAVSLDRLLDAARAGGGDAHHFCVVQMPLNLYEPGALYEHNVWTESGLVSPLDLARRENLAVLANRPLNAMVPSGLLRLAKVSESESEQLDVARLLERVSALEDELQEEIGPKLVADLSNEALDLVHALGWGTKLAPYRGALTSVEQWTRFASEVTVVLHRFVRGVQQELPEEGEAIFKSWLDRYLPALDLLLESFRGDALTNMRHRSAAVSRVIAEALPEKRRDATLSQKALWTVISTPGVTSALCGMREERYVADALEVLGWELADDEDGISVDDVYRAARRVELPEP